MENETEVSAGGTPWSDKEREIYSAFNVFAESVKEVRSPDYLHETMGSLSAPAFAQLVMNHLPLEGCSPSGSVAFWAEVAEYMGPDWIASWRKIGHMMKELDKFMSGSAE